MSLMLPPFKFCFASTNTGTASVSTDIGTPITAGVSNADGAVFEVIPALTHDCHFLAVALTGTSISGAAYKALMDVMIDPAGGTSWETFIDGLIVGYGNNFTSGGCQRLFYFPLFIKAGTSIGIRVKTSHTSAATNGVAYVWAFGDPTYPSQWWCGRGVESLGVNRAGSTGVSITPGDSNVFGSWTTIGTSGRRYGAIQRSLQPTSAVVTNIGYFFELGTDSLSLTGDPGVLCINSTTEVATFSPQTLIWCDIPTGKAIQMRGKASGTAQVHECAAYGVY